MNLNVKIVLLNSFYVEKFSEVKNSHLGNDYILLTI